MPNRIAVVLVTCIPLVCAAAPLHAADIRFGLLGGLTRADLSTDDDPLIELGASHRFHIGASLEVPMSERVSVDVRAQYVEKSVEFRAGDEFVDPAEVEAHFDFDYFSTPVYLKLHLGEEGGARPYVLGGVGLNWKMAAEIRLDAFGETETEDLDDEIEGFDATLDIGAGVAIPVSGRELFLEGLYSHGLRSIATDDDADVKTRAWLFSVGFRF